MAVRNRREAPPRPIERALLIFATIAFLYFTAPFLKPLALAVLLSFALAPIARRLERLGVPRFGSVIVTVLLALTLLGATGYVVGRQLAALADRLPDY